MPGPEALTTAVPPASHSATPTSAVDSAIRGLRDQAKTLSELSLERRIQLAESCATGVAGTAREWVEAACRAKQIPTRSPSRAEEVTSGPVSILRYLQLLIRTLHDICGGGYPQLPRAVSERHGQIRIPVFPTQHLYDGLLFRPLRAETWLEPRVDLLFGHNVARLTGESPSEPAVIAVLGAGNVSAIPASDALTKILQENKCVLLKMNPVNDYLGPIFERALAPLVEAGFLQIIYGAADAGRFIIEHAAIDEVHITGSIDTHDSIVWGGDPAERDRRKAEGKPVLQKQITSELGNHTPWAIVPGDYSQAELQFQAESIAASIVNNASFNCIATKVILTWRNWPDRERFLDLIEGILSRTSPRFAYYPGAAERFETFAGRPAEDREHLPWTLLRDVDPAETPHLFERESFVCVCAETALEGDSPGQFLSNAVEFMNERLWGTLAAAVTVPSGFQKRKADELDSALRRLCYGTIGINQWPGIAYALMSSPWGGYPGSDLDNAQSGIGFVHNTYLLDQPQKTILYSPLKFWPKPIWFPSHGNPEAVAWKLVELYHRPSLRKLPGIFYQAVRG